jgi:diguanylate cyclase (GGDEF)-like protein
MTYPATILGISALSAVLALILIGSLARNGIPGAREWCWANAALAVGVGLSSNHDFPAWLGIVAPNAAVGAASILQLVGLRRFFRRDTPLGPPLVIFAVMMCFIVYFQYVHLSFAMRVVAFSTYHAVFTCALGTVVVRFRPTNRPKYGYMFTIGIAYVAMAVNIVRAVMYVTGYADAEGPFYPTAIHVFFLTIGTMGAPSLTIGMIMMAHDRMSEALERHANIDYLTDLLGRRAFETTAAKECARVHRFGRPLTLAIIDIDFFKQINDRYGHAGGDVVLAHFASLLSNSIRSCDLAGRIGGEEFALLLPETKSASAYLVLQRLRDKLNSSSCAVGHRDVPCTFSAGVAQLEEGESFESLMERADRALYQAKQSGRDRTVLSLVAPDDALHTHGGLSHRLPESPHGGIHPEPALGKGIDTRDAIVFTPPVEQQSGTPPH